MASRFIGRRGGLAAALLLLSATGVAARSQPEVVPAVAAFEQARSLCEADGGRAWGVSLCGPMLIADPATRRVIADMDGLETPLEREGAVFRGHLPDDVPIANTAVRWNGRAWTMLVAPLPEDEPGRSVLLMHEAWHRIQDQIGLKALNSDQPQLATEYGRVSLRLELRALAAALGATDPAARRVAVEDALTFRAWRHARFPEAQAAENAMERHEGLAEYTGRLLSRDEAMIPHLAEHLGKGDRVREYARSFAYYTGPAYGLLLDAAAADWKASWDRREGLPRLLAQALNLEVASDDMTFAARGVAYGSATIQAEEAARALEQATRVASLRAGLVDGPVLVAPVTGASFSFDPNTVTPLPPEGTVYGVIRAAADWGVLTVEKDGLLSTEWSRLTVTHTGAAQTDEGLKGEGWTLTLKPEWRLTPGPRDGDWTIERRP
ncbi:hypothetical protein E4M02_01405 [Brevundimonas sp. S30B]|uniref:hypothetical protein n=1 Tax=unclassified Brevundimonas TaxID=2622653 RepID=UPI001072B174|nr:MULTISPECIES: hypothetical protein [unclassified Brevundimonas]QBX37436.1 hypothetical protein E4M01_06415 [Brevundimonas sp. MF30-B]TFW03771.1 hypothetical protein E4M02_01405 [Brevundimonas sp. S30B]